jgi:CheY-like chemotaxis protein
MYELTNSSPQLDVFTNGVASSSSSLYDEMITRLPLQVILESGHSVQKNLAEKEALHNQKKRRILLVDDEPDHCMTFQTVLEDADYECRSYTDSVKAFQEFRPSYYDLILLDIKMPVLNGFELCKKIREVDDNVHVIFITASDEYYEKSRSQYCKELDNNNNNISYIQTPIGNKELIQMVDKIMASRQDEIIL